MDMKICRICLQKEEKGTDLFSEQQVSKEILEHIYLCFQIILINEIYLPDVICNICKEELYKANNFRLKCITFEERFANLNNLKVEKPINVPAEESINFESVDSVSECGCIENVPSYKDNEDVTFECNLCNKVLKTKTALQKHLVCMHQKRKHVGKVTGCGANRRYHCTKCSYSTPHSQTLVNHMRRHNGERPYKCQCGKSFTQSSSLNAHQKIHSDSTYFTCTVCGKQFKHTYTLKNHARVHASGTFPCSICPKKLKSTKSLQEHMHRHYNIRNFNCEECGATFITCSDLLNHKKMHKEEKTVECHLCGYKTYTKRNLIVHLRRHVGEKTFKCEICDKTLYTSSELLRHRRVHTREKPFMCPSCGQRFSHSPSLNKHMRNVHGVQYKWADIKITQTKSHTTFESS